jgi:hypothetical protein
MDEGTFPTPTAAHFSFVNVHETGNSEAQGASSRTKDNAVGQESGVTRNLDSVEKLAECINSVCSNKG